MTKILVAHHSHDGQTAKIAGHVAERLRSSGADVDAVAVERAPAPDGYDVVVVGDSIRLGRHSKALVGYLRKHRDALAGTPVALFQVSMTSATDDAEHVVEAQRLLKLLLTKSGLEPDVVAEFAGALLYTKYGWVTRRIMRSIARREGNATDTSRDHEYTDWQAVDRFADAVAGLTAIAHPPGITTA